MTASPSWVFRGDSCSVAGPAEKHRSLAVWHPCLWPWPRPRLTEVILSATGSGVLSRPLAWDPEEAGDRV